MINITIKYIELATLLLLSLVSDIRTYKIKNSIVYPFILIGIVTNLYLDGLSGLKGSLLGIVIPFAILIILFALRMIGAGDVKLFSAIGSIMGTAFIADTMVYSFLAGGVAALIVMAIRRNGIKRFKVLLNYLKNCFLTRSILPYDDFHNKNSDGKFPFSCAIAMGTIIKLMGFNCF